MPEARDLEFDDRRAGLGALDVQEAIDALASRAAIQPSDGRDGLDGRDGEDGRDGLDGRDGVDGQDGAAGQDGRGGIPGAVGPSGRDGEPGAHGAQGADGPRGRDGLDGTDGADGEDGAGVPSGGVPGQILVKRSRADFDTVWRSPPKGTRAGDGAFVVWNAAGVQAAAAAESACLTIVTAPGGLTISDQACGTVFTN